jgi:hypothetical protein
MAAEELPFHLQGNFAPVADERTDTTLEVEGPSCVVSMLATALIRPADIRSIGSWVQAWCMACGSRTARPPGTETVM